MRPLHRPAAGNNVCRVAVRIPDLEELETKYEKINNKAGAGTNILALRVSEQGGAWC